MADECKGGGSSDNAGCLLMIFILWLWYVGGCQLIADMGREHREKAAQKTEP